MYRVGFGGNKSREFWNMVNNILKDCKGYKEELNHYGK
jgi:predicted metal-dependent hydrolase